MTSEEMKEILENELRYAERRLEKWKELPDPDNRVHALFAAIEDAKTAVRIADRLEMRRCIEALQGFR